MTLDAASVMALLYTLVIRSRPRFYQSHGLDGFLSPGDFKTCTALVGFAYDRLSVVVSHLWFGMESEFVLFGSLFLEYVCLHGVVLSVGVNLWASSLQVGHTYRDMQEKYVISLAFSSRLQVWIVHSSCPPF